jgi:carboxypeptidase-like protein
MRKTTNILVICYLLIVFFSDIYAQKFNNSISGYILDNSTSKPLENVNVYITNTTFGSSTDREGFYIIKSIPPNVHELIVSIVGYETIEQKLIVKMDSKIKKNFKLIPLVYEVSAIDISSSIPEEWLKNLEIFKNVFLGQTFRAQQCRIENPEVLDLQEKSGLLTATAVQPLIIFNEVLGYKIHCNSLTFKYSMYNKTWNWTIKPRYEELPSKDSTQSLTWKANRQIAYFGSMYHFLMSLKNKQLEPNGYRIFTTDKSNIINSTINDMIFIANLDSIIYPAIDNIHYNLQFDNYLLIKNYSSENLFSDFKNSQIEIGNSYQNSWLKLKHNEMTIDEYAYPIVDNNFIVYGYWATLGIADLLPKYYEFNLRSN